MPILNIILNQDCAPAQRHQLLEGVSQAVVESISAPVATVRATLHIVDAENTIVAGQVGKTLAQVTVYLLPGRTETQKQALIAALSQAISDAVGVSNQDSRIIIHDIALSDMGVAGGISAKMAGR